MTISTAPTPLSYSGNGSTVAFPITWKYNAKSHIVATLRSSSGTETTWALTTNYTLTDPGDTGTLTAVVAPASGETLVISLEPPNTQSSDIPLGGEFPSVTMEDGLDLAAQRDQKIQSLFDRSLRVPRTDTKTGSALELPIDTSRANKYLAFDADGDPIASAAAAGTAVVSTFMETVLDDTTAAAARTTLGLGTAATADTGTSGTTVPLLNGNNIHSGTLTIPGNKLLVVGDSDATKKVNFEADGLTTATTRTLTIADRDGTVDTTNRPGNIVQVVNTQTGAVATGTTQIPFDDTIPQNTEGDQYMTLAITPTSATNKLKIDVVASASSSAGATVTAALFQDSTANAVAAISMYQDTAAGAGLLHFSHYMAAGTVSATTFKLRIGTNGANTVTFNGTSSARNLGGVMASSITITEIVA